MFRRSLFVLLILIASGAIDKCIGQDTTLDSLKLALKNAKHDTTRCIIINEMILVVDDSVGLEYNKQIISIAERNLAKLPTKVPEHKVFKGILAIAINNVGIFYNRQGDIPKAFDYYNKSLKILEEIGDKFGIATALNNFAYIYTTQGDVPKALNYYNRSLNIMQEIDNKEGIANSLQNIGLSYKRLGDISKALDYFTRSLKISESIGNKEEVANALNAIGSIYNSRGDISKALTYFTNSLKLREEVGDKFEIAHSLNDIACLYEEQGDYPKALEYFGKNLKLLESIGFKSVIAITLGNMASIYNSQGNFDKALEYHSKSLKIREGIGDKEDIATSLNNIGSLYKSQGNLLMALDYYNQSLKIREEIGDKDGIAYSLNHLGTIYVKQKNYDKAVETCSKAMRISKELGFPTLIQDASRILSNAYRAKGQFQLALENYELNIKMRDSLNNIETQKATIKQQTKYEYDKQKAVEDEKHLAEIKQQEEKAAADKKRQNIIIASVSVVLLLVAIFSVILFNRFRVTQKQKAVIELKEKETQFQKHIIEEKHKEITDSINYAERIQRSFLATQSHLNSNLNHSSITVTSSSDEGAYREVSNDTSSRYSSPNVELTRTDSNYFVLFKPKDVVSGDFYWSASLSSPQGGGEGGGLFALCTADSTGHGVPGAIMSLLNITSLEKAIETETSPDEILNATRKIIIERLKKDGSEQGGKDGMDCSLCVFDFKNKKLFVANANNPVWIVRNVTSSSEAYREGVQTNGSRYDAQDAGASTRTDMEVIEIKADKMPVGKHDKQDTPFTLKEYDLQKGDIVYTLTDGFPDQFGGEKGKKFMSKNLRELLAKNSQLPMEEQKDLLEKEFKSWVGDLEQVDDVTVIGIKV